MNTMSWLLCPCPLAHATHLRVGRWQEDVCVEDILILNMNSGLFVQSTKLYHGYLLHLAVLKLICSEKYQVIYT